MNNLPSSWTIAPIVDVLEPNSNGKPFQQGWSPQCASHPAPVAKWGVLKTTAIQHGEFRDYENKELPSGLEPRSHLEVREGDLLMTCAGPRARCGVVCLVEKTRPKLMTSGKIYRFRANPEAILPRFIAYFIQSREAQISIDRMKTGISDSGLNLTHDRFAALAVPVAPVKEQRRIIAKIDELFSELDKGVENLTTAFLQLNIYRQSVLTRAFQGQLTEGWRKQNSHPISADALRKGIEAARAQQLSRLKRNGRSRSAPEVSPLSKEILEALPKIPVDWVWGKLGWLTCGVEYGTGAKSSKAGRAPVVRMGNIQDGIIDWDDLVYTSDAEEIAQYSLRSGDVLFNRTNSPELVGKTAIYRGERPALFAGYLIRVNHIEAIANSEYLNFYLNSHIAKTYGNSVKTDGVNQSNINGEKLQAYPFPYCSLDEQLEVVRILKEKLSICDDLASDITTQLSRADALRQSILKKAFSGKLVSQNEGDEPAAAFLSRIKMARERTNGKKLSNKSVAKKEAA